MITLALQYYPCVYVYAWLGFYLTDNNFENSQLSLEDSVYTAHAIEALRRDEFFQNIIHKFHHNSFLFSQNVNKLWPKTFLDNQSLFLLVRTM